MPCKVVIAEDNDLFRKTIAQVMVTIDRRYEIVGEAKDGVEAIDLVERKVPELLILDLQMPRIDGFGVMDRVRTPHPDLKILVMTMHQSEAVLQKALEYGADAYCRKTDGRNGFLAALDLAMNGDALTCGQSH